MAAPRRRARAVAARRYLRPLLAAAPVQRFLKSRIRSGPPGPTDAERARGKSLLWGEVGGRLRRAPSCRASQGPEGYTLTALTALLIMEKVLDGDWRRPASRPRHGVRQGPDPRDPRASSAPTIVDLQETMAPTDRVRSPCSRGASPCRSWRRSLPAEREPVLKQIQTPARYYYREMYLPQVTSGPRPPRGRPTAATLVVCHAGLAVAHRSRDRPSRTSSRTARATTTSPTGRPTAASSPMPPIATTPSSCGCLEIATGKTCGPSLRNGRSTSSRATRPTAAESPSSPPSTRAAATSSSTSVDGGQPGTPMRLTEDNDSRLPRYYYSRFDHYLSPDLVARRTGAAARLATAGRSGARAASGGRRRSRERAMREIHYEETSWKARPDWSRDGRRVVYSSYLGRAAGTSSGS